MALVSKTPAPEPAPPPRKRAAVKRRGGQDRGEAILRKAIDYFAHHGFTANTRNLAKELGVSQSLLYRYFPSKQALIRQVHQEIYVGRWRPGWETLVADRALSLHERLTRYYLDYASVMLQSDWVRILVYAGLEHEDIHEGFFKIQIERILSPVLRECVAEFAPAAEAAFATEDYSLEIELVWALHASIFYIGMRKWVYRTHTPPDVGQTIALLVTSFLEGMRSRLRTRHALAQPMALAGRHPGRREHG